MDGWLGESVGILSSALWAWIGLEMQQDALVLRKGGRFEMLGMVMAYIPTIDVRKCVDKRYINDEVGLQVETCNWYLK